MRNIAGIAALLLFARHYAGDIFLAADLRARQWLEYVMSGVTIVAALALVAGLAWLSPARKPGRYALLWVCLFGIVEESQVAVCGAVSYLQSVDPEPAAWVGLCGSLLNDSPIGGLTFASLIVAVVAWIERNR